MTDLVLERADLLDGLFPSSVQWRCRRDLASPASLLPQELALIEGAVPKRVTEFATGRQCAREALRDLGIADVPILFGKDRCPLWPVGTVGSITHTAYVPAKRRSTACSLATPFCTQTTGVDVGACAARSSSAAAVCWDFTQSSTAVSGVQATSAALPAARTSTRSDPSAPPGRPSSGRWTRPGR